MRPIVWLMISKIYPLRNRYRAMAVSTASNWGPKLLVRLSFPIGAGTGASHQTDWTGPIAPLGAFLALNNAERVLDASDVRAGASGRARAPSPQPAARGR